MTYILPQTVFANTRNGTATFVQADGTIATQTALNTRTNHFIDGVPGALFEPSRVNSIRNSTMQGAAVGVLLSGGALPTNWEIFGISSSNVEIVSIGTEYGLDFIDIRMNGTPSVAPQMVFSWDDSIAASGGQAWANSVYTKLQGGSMANLSGFSCALQSRDGGSFKFAYTGASFTPTTTRQRSSHAATLNNSDGSGTVTIVQSRLIAAWSSGAIDVTLRIYAPQMELGAFATTFIPTSTVAITRLADRASVALSDIGFDAGGGSIFIDGRAYYTTGGSGFPRIFQVDDGTASNLITLDIDESAGNMRLTVVSGGVSQASETMAYTSGAAFNAGFTYEAGRCVLSLNGSDSTADTSVTLPAGLTALNWASDHAGANNGAAVHISKFAAHPKEFADATLNGETS